VAETFILLQDGGIWLQHGASLTSGTAGSNWVDDLLHGGQLFSSSSILAAAIMVRDRTEQKLLWSAQCRPSLTSTRGWKLIVGVASSENIALCVATKAPL
jgi:hypothetical protein